MTEHPSTQLLEEYGRRTLSPDVFIAIQRHISTCRDCSRGAGTVTKEDYSNLLAAVSPSQTDEPYHLSTAELSGYVNEDLDELDWENAESHLEVCDECRTDVETLRHKTISTTVAWWKVHLLQSHPVQIASLVVLILLLIGFVVWRMRNSREPLQAPLQNGSKPEEGYASSSPSPVQPQDENVKVVAELYDGGRRIVLNEKGELEGAEHLPPKVQRAIKSTLDSQTLEKPDGLKELTGKPGVLLGEPVDGRPFELVEPIAIVLSNNQPTFRWRALEGASGYIVSVLDVHLDEVATSESLTTFEWKVPKKLSGGVYSWQVTAIKDGRRIISPTLPAPQARFKVLEASTVAELTRAKRDFPDYHLALGILFTRAGLIEDATREFELLQKENPDSSFVKNLLDQVRAMQKTK